MDKRINIKNVTPCGECCDWCEYKLNGECAGCRVTNGEKCKMWSNGCNIYKCTIEHNVYHCGLCEKFPCEWLVDTTSKWNSESIKTLTELVKKQ